MKKFFLSSFVIIAFLIHSFKEQNKLQTPQSFHVPTTPSPTVPAPAKSVSAQEIIPTLKLEKSLFKDGEYMGDVADAFYGNIQVKAVIQNGKITDVQFLQYPNDRENSIEVNIQAMPLLKSEAIQAQSGQVDIVSGATESSIAFIQSLTSALAKAK